ncbi:hypothetical protein M153_15500013220 [Pseudoloma neurophilia]|uniref:Uncharacterized protein n=1 Tax=Pseudoloma neurophilia TaxID=146866 RepID=A0A0R0LZS0_9MICR|nr:hypothetical protein M153_15500013220 [Pseudoloma neurophilia]
MFKILLLVTNLLADDKYLIEYEDTNKFLTYDGNKLKLESNTENPFGFQRLKDSLYIIESDNKYICKKMENNIQSCDKKQAKKIPWKLEKGKNGFFNIFRGNEILNVKKEDVILEEKSENEMQDAIWNITPIKNAERVENLTENTADLEDLTTLGRFDPKLNPDLDDGTDHFDDKGKILPHLAKDDEDGKSMEVVVLKDTDGSEMIQEKLPTGTIIYSKSKNPDNKGQIEIKKIFLNQDDDNETQFEVFNSQQNGVKKRQYVFK